MLSWLINLFGLRTLNSALNQTKAVKINGVKFKIKKINPLDHLDGSKVMLQYYDVHKTKNQDSEISSKKIKEHFEDVLLAGIVSPSVNKEIVDKMMNDWGLVNKLYEEIMTFTYGKKKLIF